MWFTLPVIILQTVTGVLSFAHSNFEGWMKEYLPLFIGSLNILGGMITTISQFLQVGELKEAHRVASLEFSKLSRSIRIELALPLRERSHDGADFMSICRVKLDQLLEQSPSIREDVLIVFERTFRDDINNEAFALPEILDIHPVNIYDRALDQAEKKQAERVSSIVANAASTFKNLRRPRPQIKAGINRKFKKASTPRLSSSVKKVQESSTEAAREEVQKELGALMKTNVVKKLREKYDSPQPVTRELPCEPVDVGVDAGGDVGVDEAIGDEIDMIQDYAGIEIPPLDGPMFNRESSLAERVSQMSQESESSRRPSDASIDSQLSHDSMPPVGPRPYEIEECQESEGEEVRISIQ